MNRSAHSSSRPRSRLQFECIFASLWLAIGLFVLPAIIYWVGIVLLGPYGEGAGPGTFYADFFSDLAAFSAPAWLIALGPVVLVSLLRLVFFNWRAREHEEDDEADEARPQPRARSAAPGHARERPGPRTRIEPRIGQDPQ